jgi:hypothetical protein
MGGGQYISTGKDSMQNSVVLFSLPEKVGALAQALHVFEVSSTNNKCKVPFKYVTLEGAKHFLLL